MSVGGRLQEAGVESLGTMTHPCPPAPLHPPPPGPGASDLSGRLGGFIPTAAAMRAPLILAARVGPSHEVPGGGIRPQTNSRCVLRERWGGGLGSNRHWLFIQYLLNTQGGNHGSSPSPPSSQLRKGPRDPQPPTSETRALPGFPSLFGKKCLISEKEQQKKSEIILPFENQSQFLIRR